MLSIPETKREWLPQTLGVDLAQICLSREVVCTWASKKAWTPSKMDSLPTQAFLGDAHGRDHINKVKLAVDEKIESQLCVLTPRKPRRLFICICHGHANIFTRHIAVGSQHDIQTFFTNVRGAIQL